MASRWTPKPVPLHQPAASLKYLLNWAVDQAWSYGPRKVTGRDHRWMSGAQRIPARRFPPYQQMYKEDPRSTGGYIPPMSEPRLPHPKSHYEGRAQ